MIEIEIRILGSEMELRLRNTPVRRPDAIWYRIADPNQLGYLIIGRY